jgi:hypothetical protein
MKQFRLIIILVLVTLLRPEDSFAQQRGDASTNASSARVYTNFTGILKVKSRRGEQQVPVAVYAISMDGHKVVRELAVLSTGLALVQFHSGKIETKARGESFRTKGGEFLLFNATDRPGFTTDDDSATMHAVVFGGAFTNTDLPIPKTVIYPEQGKYSATNGEPLKIQVLPPKQMGDYYLEARDLLVGPSKTTELFSFQGAAVLEIRSGNGVLNTLGKEQKIHGGTVVTLTEGQTLQLTNKRDDLGLLLRITLLRRS